MVGLLVTPGGAQAQSPAACTATATPSSVTVDANEDLTASSAAFTLSYSGDTWPDVDVEGSLVPGVYVWMGVEAPNSPDLSPFVAPLPLTILSDNASVTYEQLVEIIAGALGVDPSALDSGSYSISYDFSTSGDSLVRVCGVTWDITFVAEGDTLPDDDLPETGASTATMWAWATALLGMGAVSVLAASRRRA